MCDREAPRTCVRWGPALKNRWPWWKESVKNMWHALKNVGSAMGGGGIVAMHGGWWAASVEEALLGRWRT
jgi:hypothetical protein